MSIKRIVDVSFWEDEKVIEEFSSEEKLFMLYLMTNTHTTQLGVYRILYKQIADEIGISIEDAKRIMNKFENDYGNIKYSPTTREVAIKNYLRYSIVKGGVPVYDLLVKESNAVKDKSLLLFVLDGALKSENKTVQQFCQYLINENVKDKENENVNDNDNEYSYHESSKHQNEGIYPLNDRLIPIINESVAEKPTYRSTNRNPKYDRVINITSDYGKGEAK